jgi:acetolactate synthase-1/2/3 large subunit
MNGAQALLKTLVASGVDVCFMNPGTSEMHFVAALDSVPAMRPILGLFEGVVTGAADGYARMADKPACTLLHLGPGMANALANTHNARKARTPMLNIVGEHATYHRKYDAPLTSDIEALARPLSHWVRTTLAPTRAAADVAEAVAAASAPPGQIATLILPADVCWSEAGEPARPAPVAARGRVAPERVREVAAALRSGEPCAILMNGHALRDQGLVAASRVANTGKARLLVDTFAGRIRRGAGIPPIERLPYFAEMAFDVLKDMKHLILVGTQPPVSFFAYPGVPNYLVPDTCRVHELASPSDDAIEALEHLADELGAAKDAATVQKAARSAEPSGKLDAKAVGEAVGAHLPEGAIVADEGATEGFLVPVFTAGAPPHDWLQLTGGAIGIGIPLATGAAVACPGRKVLNLQADGSAMYTLQGLWTQAREKLDVVTVLFANRSYRILNIELQRVGAEGAGQRARDMLDIGRPDLDFVALARGMGVDATRAETAEAFNAAFARAMHEPGPALIECVMQH